MVKVRIIKILNCDDRLKMTKHELIKMLNVEGVDATVNKIEYNLLVKISNMEDWERDSILSEYKIK